MFNHHPWGIELQSDYQMSNALSCQHVLEVHTYKWQEEFYAKIFTRGRTLARPYVWKGMMCFGGGLQPMGLGNIPDHQILLFTSRLEYVIVPLAEVRDPNDKEYDRYFRKIIDANLVTICESEMQGVGAYIKVGSKTYKHFKKENKND